MYSNMMEEILKIEEFHSNVQVHLNGILFNREKMDALLTCCVEQTRCHLTLMSISTSILPVECYTSPNASQRTPRGLLDTSCQSQLLTMASLSLAVGSPSQSMLFVTAMDQYSPAIHMKPLSMNQSQPAPVYCKYRPQMLME